MIPVILNINLIRRHYPLPLDNIGKIVNVSANLSNWYGNETVIFTAFDGQNYTNMSVTIVIVSSVNDPPIVNLTTLQNYIISEDSSNNSINLSNYVYDVEDSNDLINWSCISNNVNVTATPNNITKLLNINR